MSINCLQYSYIVR